MSNKQVSMAKEAHSVLHIVVLCMFICWAVVGVYLRYIDKLADASFVSYLALGVAGALALYGFDRLRELGVGNCKLVLAEIKEKKQDFDEEVRTTLEELANSKIYSALHTGRVFDMEHIFSQMIENRERARSLLHKAGKNARDIEDALRPINDRIARDLVQLILQDVATDLEKRLGPAARRQHETEWQNLRTEAAATPATIAIVKSHIDALNVPLSAVETSLANLEHFITHKQLPE